VNAGAQRAGDHGAETRQFGIGREARIAAMRAADELKDRGVAAAAVFKPSMGGWIVRVYPGGIRRRSDDPRASPGLPGAADRHDERDRGEFAGHAERDQASG
jgi:hypothetical protein